MICARCGRENDADARFCSGCGARLESAPSREERKVVTILFADIVGSTARAEQLDPEDVRAALSRYYGIVRVELERHGGTVEKFIGDAVMAVYGAPTAHEDDPERAVRAGFAIRDALAESDVDVRIAVHTGEALVSLDARPEDGESMVAGDVVNTAARLQSAAPVNGVIVGEATYRATQQVIEFRPLESVSGKGKSQPIVAWEAVAPRARFGVDVDESEQTQLVGRSEELDVLRGALVRARKEHATQLVTLVGVPGIGKTRLVTELMALVDDDPDLIWWRQCRCLPYGEGTSFWALSEMIKAQAGVLETDTAERAETKLRTAVAALIVEPGELEWVLGHVRPLLGLPGHTGERAERFAAWRRLIEALALQRPLVLVFEDLHWADDGMLDFVDYLAEWAGPVPLLLICSARPELLERRPGWGGGKRNATTVSLAPLSDDDVGRLIARLLEQAVLPADTQRELLRRAGGNPLYAEQYVRMLQEGRDPRDALPENVQGIIAARLDTLPPEEKALLQDAAVVGKVFWLGIVGAIGGSERWTTEERLHSLERREFVRRERRASIGAEAEYAFRHVLVRDVAYNQIPRPVRARKHRAAADWIDSLGSERAEDRSELLAHHYGAALELTRSAGLPDGDLPALTKKALFEAGERSWALGALETACERFRAALELTDESDPAWPRLLRAYGSAVFRTQEAGEEELARASAALLEAGHLEGMAEAERDLSELLWGHGRVADSLERLRVAKERLEGAPPSVGRTQVLLSFWRNQWLATQDAPGEINDEALADAERLDRRDLIVTALLNRALNQGFGDGDRDAIAAHEQAIALAQENGLAEISRGYINFASLTIWFGDERRGAQLHQKGLEVARRFGDLPRTRFLEAEIAIGRISAGHWDAAVSEGTAFVEECATAPHYMEVSVRAGLSGVAFARQEDEAADAHLARAVELAAGIGDTQVSVPVTAIRARRLAERGDHASARAALLELRELRPRAILLDPSVIESALAAALIGEPGLLTYEAATETPWSRAVSSIADGDLADAADECEGGGNLYYAALLGLYAILAGEDVTPARREQVSEFFRSVGARRYQQQLDLPAARAS